MGRIADGAPLVYGPNGEKSQRVLIQKRQFTMSSAGKALCRWTLATAAVFIDYDNRQFEFIVPNPSDGTL